MKCCRFQSPNSACCRFALDRTKWQEVPHAQGVNNDPRECFPISVNYGIYHSSQAGSRINDVFVGEDASYTLMAFAPHPVHDCLTGPPVGKSSHCSCESPSSFREYLQGQEGFATTQRDLPVSLERKNKHGIQSAARSTLQTVR